MIKYAEIKGYRGVGEVAPHLYQWVEMKDLSKSGKVKALKDRYGAIVLVRAYDTDAKIWCGYIINGNKTYINGTSKPKRDYDDISKLLGGVEFVTDLKDFLEGSEVESQFDEYIKTTWKEMVE